MNQLLSTMKKISLFIILILFSSNFLFAQAWLKSLEDKKENEEITFFDIQKAFNDYWKDYNVVNGKYLKDGKMVKAPGWKQFKRWEWYWEYRVDPQTGKFPKTNTATEWEKFKAAQGQENNLKDAPTSAWTSLGPNSSLGGYAGIGRINCISFHPSNTSTFWIGSPSGGLWKTTDGGSTWTVLTDDNDVMGVSDIAIPSDYETSQTIYIATGDRDGGSVWTLNGMNSDDNQTVGVLKSIDGGNTWTNKLPVNRSSLQIMGFLKIHPSDNNILYAGIYNKIYKSTNAGENWTELYTFSNYAIDMEFKPGDPNTIYVSTDTYSSAVKIYRTTDGGANWTTQHTFDATDRRIELAVTDDNPNIVFALIANRDGGLSGIYKSSNSGDSFRRVYDGSISGHYLLNWSGNGAGTNNGQGGYDLALAVSPIDSNLVFVGGVNTWRSTNGGLSFSLNNAWTSGQNNIPSTAEVVHADHHCLKYQNDNTLFETNDGGVYKTTNNGTDWSDLSNGLVISQIYRLSVSQSEDGLVLTGLQDNGSKKYQSSNWRDVLGGDGMECIIHPDDPNIQWGSRPNGDIIFTPKNWNGLLNVSNNISNGTLEGWWVTPYVLDRIDKKTLYVGYDDVWKSSNLGLNTFIKITDFWLVSGEIRSMALAPSNNQVLYVAKTSNIWRTTNGGTNWTEITSNLPTSTNRITYIAVDSNDPDHVWVSMGGYNLNRVYESTNGGSNWTNISTGLPNMPTFCIVHNKMIDSENHLYAATDRGVFFKKGTDNWVEYNTGLPNVMVTELEIYYDENNPANNKLYAATYGRGLWSTTVESAEVDAAVTAISPNENYCGVWSVDFTAEVTNVGTNPITSLTVRFKAENFTTDVDWNDGDLGTHLSNQGDKISFTLPALRPIEGENTFKVSLTNINGSSTDANTTNNVDSTIYTYKYSDYTLPIEENFNLLSDTAACWTIEIVTNNSNVSEPVDPALTVTSYSIFPSAAPYEGEKMLNFNSAFCDIGDQIRLISPDFSTVGKSDIKINFMWYESKDYATDVDNVKVQWSTDGVNWNTLSTINRVNGDNVGWAEKSVTLPSGAEEQASIYVALLFTSQYGHDCNLDLFSITQSSISVGTISGSPFSVSNTNAAEINIPYTTSTAFTGNTFTAYLSDATGSFTNEVNIGSLTSDTDGTIVASIPSETASGSNYMVRIKSSNPVFTSDPSSAFIVNLDNTRPTVTINSDENDPTSNSPFTVNINFSEVVTGFELADITVGNGSAANLTNPSTTQYSVEITPTTEGEVTVDVTAGVAEDAAGNGNTVASQFSITYSTSTGYQDFIDEKVSFYPNPIENNLHLHLVKTYNFAAFKIIDITGKVIDFIEITGKSDYDHNMSNYKSGTYVLQMILDEKILNASIVVK